MYHKHNGFYLYIRGENAEKDIDCTAYYKDTTEHEEDEEEGREMQLKLVRFET